MNYLKIIGIAIMAAVATMAFVASSASATVLYKGAEAVKAGTPIVATLSGSATLKSTGGTLLNTCTGSEIKAEIANAGGASATVSGPINTLNWGVCTEPTKTTIKGELEMHQITNTINATVTFKKTTFDVNTTVFGAECQWTVGEALDTGPLAGSKTGDATILINTVISAENAFFCPDAKLEALFNVTSPTPMHAAAS
jgi:hypothetical protein